MRVLLVTSLGRGGPLEHALVLADHLRRMGNSVSAVCAGETVADRFRAAGADPYVIPLRHQADAVNGYRVWQAARGADVVHAQDRRAGLWTRIWPRRRGQPRIYTVHGLPDPYLPESIPGHRPARLRDRLAYRRLDPYLARRSDAVVVASRFLAGELVDRLRFPAGRIVVVPNGVEEPVGEGRGRELVGTVSVLDAVKGLDVFLRAAAIVREQMPSTRFAIFGDGPERERLEAIARAPGLAGAVDFPGHVPAADALAQLRLFVISSWLENCPMSLLEAMATGVPALATNVGGVPEVTGEAVPLVPAGDPQALADAITMLLQNSDLAARNVRLARERVSARFTAERNAADLAGLYERLLEERR